MAEQAHSPLRTPANLHVLPPPRRHCGLPYPPARPLPSPAALPPVPSDVRGLELGELGMMLPEEEMSNVQLEYHVSGSGGRRGVCARVCVGGCGRSVVWCGAGCGLSALPQRCGAAAQQQRAGVVPVRACRHNTAVGVGTEARLAAALRAPRSL